MAISAKPPAYWACRVQRCIGGWKNMGFEKRRLLLSALLWLAAGALCASASSSARAWVSAGVLLLVGIVVAWPLARARVAATSLPEPSPPSDAPRPVILQAQLEHLPVAAWVQVNDQKPQPLSSRARQLAAPGGVRDHEALNQLLRSSNRSGPVVLDTERGSVRWQLRRQPLALDGQSHTLLVLVPLEQELESESLLAWQQLTQVLTHEIMNSLTPIKSLSETAMSLLDEPDGAANLRTALDAIGRRADNLSSFVETYRRVSRWPQPTLAPVELRSLFSGLEQAVGPAWALRGGEARFELGSPSLRLQADEGQLEQALLALFHNAEQ